MRLWLSNQASGLKFKVQLRSQPEGAVMHPSPRFFQQEMFLQKQQKLGNSLGPAPKGFICLGVCLEVSLGGVLQGSVYSGLWVGACKPPAWLGCRVSTPLARAIPKTWSLNLKPGLWVPQIPNGHVSGNCPKLPSVLAGWGWGGRGGGVPWIGPVPVTSEETSPLSGLSHPVCMMLWEDKNDHQGALHLKTDLNSRI